MKNIAEIYQTSFLIFFTLICIFGKKNKLFIFLYPILTVACCVLVFLFLDKNLFVGCVYFCLYFIIPILLIRTTIRKLIYVCFVCIGISSDLICLVYIISFCFCDISNMVIISVIVSTLLFICIYFFIIYKRKVFCSFVELFSVFHTLYFLFPAIIWIFFFLLSAEYAAMNRSSNIEINIIILFVTLILLVASIILFAYLIINNLKKQHYKKLSDVLEDNIIKQAKHYEKTIKMYNDLRTFKHDYNNLKIGLNNLLETGQIDEAIKYLNSSNEKFKTQYQQINTGNTIVDAIFSDKQSEIIQNNIKIKFNGIIPYDALEIADLCVVLGNSLDNAVEACAKMPITDEKIIEIEVKKNRELLLIQMKNPIHDKVNINNNTVKTTKENAEVHGIGFYSINNIVKKYDGFYEITSDDTHFTLKMGFMIKNK